MRLYFGVDKPTLVVYSNSDMAGDIDSRMATSSYMVKFAGGVVAWQSRLQKCVTLSTTDVEFIDPTFHNRSKHIDVRYHWIHDVLDAKLLELAKVHTNDNGYDMMTKALPRGKFEVCCDITGLAISST
ncbi:hypothetical protein KIW84_075031 [Lathyrus oleraceus]|uniref:Retrovirus-related Pol polyprotein from transposon TNT 1-94 n=1 Tax=Pisum sativum TaxID=3888 RepID=A0A9D5A1D8_PEA|nr:hypothetical protein KIW84_075031 [Pisum sativum]